MTAGTPESSADYLSRYNCKQLMEWLTVRCILHRPEDPMQFISDLLTNKLKARGGVEGYDPNIALSFLKESYDDAMSAADEHGIIHSEAVSKLGSSRLDMAQVPAPLDTVVAGSPGGNARATATAPSSNTSAVSNVVVEHLKELASLELPPQAALHLMSVAKTLVPSDVSTYFHLESSQQSLHLSTEEKVGEDKPTTKVGKGLVGAAAKTGNVVMVHDATCDVRYFAESDGAAGEVGPMLCVPVFHTKKGGEETPVKLLQGVLMIARSQDGEPYNEADAESIKRLSETAGIAMANSALYDSTMHEITKFKAMVDVMKAFHRDMGSNHLLYTLSSKLPRVCDAHKCTCFMVDADKDELWAVQGEVNMRFPISQGIVGAVVRSGTSINIPDAYADNRFNSTIDKETNYHTKAVLAMPIRSSTNEVIGVVQLINKVAFGDIHGGVFTQQDEHIMGTFLSVIGPILSSTIATPKPITIRSAANKEMHPKVSPPAHQKRTSPKNSLQRLSSSPSTLKTIECGDMEDEEERSAGGAEKEDDEDEVVHSVENDMLFATM